MVGDKSQCKAGDCPFKLWDETTANTTRLVEWHFRLVFSEVMAVYTTVSVRVGAEVISVEPAGTRSQS